MRLAATLLAILTLTMGSAFASGDDCALARWRQTVDQLEQIRAQAQVAGLALLVVGPDRVVCVAYRGLADRASGRAVDSRSWFRVGSISKSFTALGALRMAEAGQLDLRAPLAGVIGDLAPDNPWAPTHPLNLGQLLQHSAGLADMSGTEFDYPNQGQLSLVQALAIRPQSRALRWPPGLHTSYSNSGAGLVGLAMERAGGEPFEALMQTHVLEPLGMVEASFERSALVGEHLVTAYNSDGHSVIPYWHIIYRPAGGLNLRPAMMAPFLQMLLREGQTDNGSFLSVDSVRLFEDPSQTLSAHSGLRFGRGMGSYHEQYRGHTLHGHGGDADGYLAHYAYSREAGLGYFLVINAFQPPTLRRMRARVERQLVAALPKPAYPPAFKLTEAELEARVGEYAELTRRFGERGRPGKVRLEARSGRLFSIDADGDRIPMIAVNAHHFRRPWQSVATMALIQDADQRWILQGEIGNYGRVAEGE